MAALAAALAENRSAVAAFLADVDQSGATWTTPRAPGKWTPAQVTEHLARAYEESAKVCASQKAAFPSLPGFLRPVARGLLFNRVVRSGRFPKARTNRPMDPLTGPATPAEGRARLEQAVAMFEQQATTICASDDSIVTSLTFGKVRVIDWVQFQAAHSRHHQGQLKIGS